MAQSCKLRLFRSSARLRFQDRAECGTSRQMFRCRMIVEMVAFLVIFDVMFYHSHRLLHTHKFYQYHKVIFSPYSHHC